MTAIVTRLRPREFYAVVPGAVPDGGGEPEPVFYARTFDGLNSAIVHARHLSSGGGEQEITLTEGRRTRMILRFANGRDVTGKLTGAAHRTRLVPVPEAVRPGSPRGHIPEICSTAKNRAAGRKPRKNPNCPPCEWPGLD